MNGSVYDHPTIIYRKNHITQPEKPLKFSIGTKTVGSVRYAET